jgi:hypothetical protein
MNWLVYKTQTSKKSSEPPQSIEKAMSQVILSRLSAKTAQEPTVRFEDQVKSQEMHKS